MADACERCERIVPNRFEFLGRNLCFACLRVVRRLTSGYAVLDAITSADMDHALGEVRRDPASRFGGGRPPR